MKGHAIVQTAPIDVAAALADLAPKGEAGAMVSFTGHVRAEDGSDTLTLEHYPGMTEKQMHAIAHKAQARFDLTGWRIIHRVGLMQASEAIVLVIATAQHRHAAFGGAQFIMDWLKTEAPFWKKTGTGQWVDARDRDEAAKARWE